jgi:UDP-2,3-diacylglucosamine pyrophosphatase LpxH
MATALDLLMSTKEDVNLLSEESDICTIDAKTRAIFVPSTIVVGGVQSDKNAERIKFSCPKIVGDNLDLSKFSVRINFENVSSVDFNVSIKDQYICDDVAVDGENVTFSWLIGRNAARYMGTVRFIVCAVKTDSDSNISVEWNTAIAEVPVLEGIEIDQPQIGQEEKDVINQLLELTKNTSAEAVQNVNSAKEQAIKDIQSVSQPDTTLTIEGGLAEAKATGEAIGSLKEDLETYYKNGYDFDGELAEIRYEGYGWNGNPMQKTESSYMKCIEVSVKPNELYSFDLQIGNDWIGIAFVDKSNNIIKSYIKQAKWKTYIDYRAKAPEGSVKALINSNKNGSIGASILTNRKYKYILPRYYRNHLDVKIDEINSAIAKDEAQDYYGVGYIFVTDIHAPANTWTFLPLIERIRALTNAKMLINCGDNVRALGTKEDLISDLREVMNKTFSVFGKKMIYVMGNHDFVISDSDAWGTNMVMIAKALNYQINLSPLGISTRKHYYYVDDNVGMIRHIIIDYTDTDKSWFVEWLRDTIKSTPTDYHFAFYMHWNVFEKDGAISDAKYQYLVDWISALQKKTTFSENISTTFGDVKINEDYTDTTHAVCYFACGHQHTDYMHVVNGVTYFVSDCCANHNDNGVVNRVSGTTTDTAFDVICANVKKRSVTLIRVGAGSNRSWTY